MMTIDLVAALQPNEEENDVHLNQRVFAGRIFTAEEIEQAKFAELDRLQEYHAKVDVEPEARG